MIKLKEVSKYYYSDKTVTLALKDINLEFKKGEFVAITGKSGSGKSTLINLISGMDTYEEGELYFKGMETSFYGEDDWEQYRKNNISFVYQSYNLVDSYTALENVEAVMMICENDENRLSKKERRKKAMEVLKKVGLEKQAHNKASHMSSGQKQRLGIARALAKNTDVIIADEPTGNLDVENGSAVMALFHQLAMENKLVIVVTHNYEQAEPYVTRKIRLFDGEVVEDMKINEELYRDRDFQSDYETEIHEEKEAKKTFSTAVNFVHMNRFAQPHRSIFILFFAIVSAMATLVFLGYFMSNIDDTGTRNISKEIFENTSDKRIIIKRMDGRDIDENDMEALLAVKYVQTVDRYDRAGDFCYFSQQDDDYKVEYEMGIVTKRKKITKIKCDKFLMSSYGLTDSDLSSGTLPQNYNEIVMYSEDEDILGTEKEIYISGRDWRDEYVGGNKFKIVGILKKKTNQIYFSEDYLRSVDCSAQKLYIRYQYNVTDIKEYKENTEKNSESEKKKNVMCDIVIGDGLSGRQVRLSRNIYSTLFPEGKDCGEYVQYSRLKKEGVISIQVNGELVEYEVEIADGESMCDEGILEVSPEIYTELLGSDLSQASVYIEDYAYTDRVLESLGDAGYDAVSALRVSAKEYNPELVSSRMIMLLVSVGVIGVIFVLDILVLFLLMKLKKGDFRILKSLGMKQRMINQINYYDLVTIVIMADIVAIAAGYICNVRGVPLIGSLMKYMDVRHYMCLIVINGVMSLISAALYNMHLSKKFRLTEVKGE